MSMSMTLDVKVYELGCLSGTVYSDETPLLVRVNTNGTPTNFYARYAKSANTSRHTLETPMYRRFQDSETSRQTSRDTSRLTSLLVRHRRGSPHSGAVVVKVA